MADPIGSFSGLASGIQWRDMVDQIMYAEEARRVTPLQTQKSEQQKRIDAWTSFQSLVGKLTGAAKALQDGSAFEKLSVSTGTTAAGKALFGASASGSAAPGRYGVEVVSLAKAEKLGSVQYAATDTALGLSGEFAINGRAVQLDGSETLAQLRDRINATNRGANPSGVTATLLSTGSGQNRLVLTADATGARGIEMADVSGGALASLGLVQATKAENGSAAAPQSFRFASKEPTPFAEMLGLQGPPDTQKVVLGGREIEIDLTRDTIQSVLLKLTDAGGTGRVVEESVGGRTTYRLQVDGAVGASANATDAAQSQRIVELLGFSQNTRATLDTAQPASGGVIAAGSDAQVKIDGFTITRPGNTVSDAIAGVTLNLQAAAPGETVELSIARDTGAMVGAVKGLASAYNEIRAFQDRQSTLGSPLYANGTLRSTVAQLTSVLLGDLKGLPAGSLFSRGAVVGVALSRTGTLEVDEAKLKQALEANLADVKSLFGTAGSASGAGLSFISSGAKTQAGSYTVEVTQPATRGALSGGDFATAYAAGTGATGAEKLTIRDAFSGGSLAYTVPAGKTLSEVVAELNAGFAAQRMKLTASESGGALRLEHAEYGTPGSFTLSDGETAADGATSAAGGLARLGLAAGTTAGQDVKGLLYTDAAAKGSEITGRGQVLTGGAGTAAEGLALKYTGATADASGALRLDFGLGLGGLMARQSELVGRTGDGTIALQLESLQGAQTRLDTRIDDATAILERRRESMIRQFAKMEEAMSRITAQGNWLSSQLQAMNAVKK